MCIRDRLIILGIFLAVGRYEHELRTFFFRLPYGLGSYDAKLFCQFVFGENDAAAAFGIAAYGHRDFFELGA